MTFPSVHAPVLPGISPSGRWQFPRLQLRGSAGFSPASLTSPSGEVARSEEFTKIKTTVVEESNGCPLGSQSHLDFDNGTIQNKTNRGWMENLQHKSRNVRRDPHRFHLPTTYNTIESTTLTSSEVAKGK